jgi:integrase
MDSKRRARSRVRITDTFAQNLERHLESRGQSLERPQEVRDSLLAGLVLRRESTGRKSWHYGYSFKGRRGRIKIGNCPALSVEGARQAAKLVSAQVAKGIDPAAEKRKEREELSCQKRQLEKKLGAFIEGPYRTWAEANLNSHKETIDALKADFGDSVEEGRKNGAGWWTRDMDKISVEDADQWRSGQLKLGNKATTINRAWQRLRAVLGKAVDWKHIAGPPLRVAKLRTDKRGRVRFLSAEERSRLFRALAERERQRRQRREAYNALRVTRHRPPLPTLGVFTDYLQPLTRTWLGTGMRRKEALSLRWGYIDFVLDLINLPGEITKTRQSRVVPIPSDLRECLLAWRAQQPHASLDDLVFSRNGQRIHRVYRAWKALMKLAQITNFRAHDCRHDYASRLAMADVSLKTIAELLGHEDLTQVQRYAHLSQKHLRDSTNRLARDPITWTSPASAVLPPAPSESLAPEVLPVAA